MVDVCDDGKIADMVESAHSVGLTGSVCVGGCPGAGLSCQNRAIVTQARGYRHAELARSARVLTAVSWLHLPGQIGLAIAECGNCTANTPLPDA